MHIQYMQASFKKQNYSNELNIEKLRTMSSNSDAPSSLPIKFLREDEISQETQDLMSTLPQHKAWLFSAFYKYQGFWYSSVSLNGTLAMQKHFQARDSDVFIVSTPKSATTWLKAVGFALIHRAQYNATPDAAGLKDHPLLNKNPHELVPLIEMRYDKVMELPSLPSPRLISTHLPISSLPGSVGNSNCKIVYMCRDPKDVVISLFHYVNKMRDDPFPLEEMLDMFCNGVSPWGPFWDHVLGYWKASLETPEKVLFIKYEEMKEQPLSIVKRIAEFSGCPFSVEEEDAGMAEEVVRLCSFENLSNLEVNRAGKLPNGQDNNIYFRKGNVGSWKDELKPEMAARIDQITEQKFYGTGLKL